MKQKYGVRIVYNNVLNDNMLLNRLLNCTEYQQNIEIECKAK